MSQKAEIVNYKPGKTARDFHKSRSFVRSLMGPVGSGKSVACCFEGFMISQRQAPDKSGVRRSRGLIVRNTLPQLETTTIKTWLDWFPEHIFGKITKKPPYTQHIRYSMPDGTRMELEVIFIALDKPEDVKKLLSLECTWIWFNEVRETEKELIDAATGRVGRYPSVKDRPDDLPESEPWPTWSGIIMDTNPPDDSHWLYRLDVEHEWRKDAESGLIRPLEEIPDVERWSFFRQPSGRSPEAENVENLPDNYYGRISSGKTPEWIRVYVDGEYGFVQEGEPVYKNSYNQKIHIADHSIPLEKGREIFVGVDCSGRNPAAVLAQKRMSGQICIFAEFVCEGMGAQLFADLFSREIKSKYSECDISYWGDPAGFFKGSSDERTYADILASRGIRAKPCPVIRIAPRLEAVQSAFLTLGQGGQPSILISPECKVLVRGLNGGYKYRRLQISGDAKYSPEPEKNRFSDVQDALQYLMCGLGAYKKMLGKDRSDAQARINGQPIADVSSWKI